jgi:uncharacterized DUF497 family protein
MEITWDEFKRQTNIKNHGLDFMDARVGFDFREALVEPTYPSKDGRTRFTAIGPLKDDVVAVVFSPLGREGLAIISLRPASRKERKRYEQS